MTSNVRGKLTRGKVDGINACANERGVIAAVAIDQRGSLRRAIAQARGDNGPVAAADLREFKGTAVRVLSEHASAVLLDPEYGLEASHQRAPGTGLLLAYEETGYDPATPGRLPRLLSEWSARRLIDVGATAIKVLLYYNAFDNASINSIKQAFVERVGAECIGLDRPFFLEIVSYDDALGDVNGQPFARAKPRLVTGAIEEFSQPQYGVDVLKVEVPVNLRFVEGSRANAGAAAVYTRRDAVEHIRTAAGAASKPLIYLSGGVHHAVFAETLDLIGESGVTYAGMLCGRAIWQEGVPLYAREGRSGLERWLGAEGIRNLATLTQLLAISAKPWWTVYGARAAIEVV